VAITRSTATCVLACCVGLLLRSVCITFLRAMFANQSSSLPRPTLLCHDTHLLTHSLTHSPSPSPPQMLRLAELFGISNFIVSQVNPYVAPLLRKTWNPNASRLWTIEKFLQLDVRYRFQVLAKLGLIPRMFGQNIDGVFKQRYSGRVTILPEISLLDNFKAIMNPTRKDMRRYLGNGERAYWPVADFTQVGMNA
jgi:hypothetical protein